MVTKKIGLPGMRFAAALALGALSIGSAPAAQENAAAARAAAMPLPSLERAFWWCDHAATTRGVGDQDGKACMAVYDELKKRRFDGDFDRLVSWWRENKVTQHRLLDQSNDESDVGAGEGGGAFR